MFSLGFPSQTGHFPCANSNIFHNFICKTGKYRNVSYILESGNSQLEQTKFPVFWQNFQIPYVFPDRELLWPFSQLSLCSGHPDQNWRPAQTGQQSLFFFFFGMFYQLLRVQHSCYSTQSWGSVLPSIVETRDQNSRGCPLLFSNRNLGSFCA